MLQEKARMLIWNRKSPTEPVSVRKERKTVMQI